MTLAKKPPWIRSIWPCSAKIAQIKKTLRENKVKTVCEEANCPNLGECFGLNTATFMIMGENCTRNCLFCNVKHKKNPAPIDTKEPKHLAKTVEKMKLKYVVITSVTRDDLPDGGAKHFADCIKKIRGNIPEIKIEILTPDFKHCQDKALKILKSAPPDVFNHNIETVPSLYSKARPKACYQTSLSLLKKHKELLPNILTKSGLMLGLGETKEEIKQTFCDLLENDVEILTLGQYLQPTKNHLKVSRYLTPEEFLKLKRLGLKLGFKKVVSSPLARSSYHAGSYVDFIL